MLNDDKTEGQYQYPNAYHHKALSREVGRIANMVFNRFTEGTTFYTALFNAFCLS